ncbi:MAG TPA: magnesium transporter [Hyphomicrobiaceae bacterium]|nr:magnesium transporter [Hyphomicrobiaceae bacterium]
MREHKTGEFGASTPISELAPVVADALAQADAARTKALVAGLQAPDLADLIEFLEPEQRQQLVASLDSAFDPEALSELEEGVRDQLLRDLPNETVAKAVAELETDDAAYVLENLEEADRQQILALIPRIDRAALERSLEYPEDSAGRLMQTDFVAVPPFWSIGQVIDHMREADDLPDTFSDIYVVDATYHVVGSVDLSRLLRTKREVPVAQIMDGGRQTVLATADQEEVARQFERYDLKSAPVVDANKRLVGVVTVDDVVEVMHEETEEDLRRLGGVGNESVMDTVVDTVRNRFAWLLINLGTALLASSVIKLFDATIGQMVALAVLMPVVASMGGNAATQTMTVTVRALATRDLGPANTLRVIVREASVGFVNGVAFAAIVGLVVLFWFGIGTLGLVIATAMIANFLAAALAGILIPLALARFGYDPAVASGVFVTMVTDVVGFFAFLGLASLWLR